MYNFLRNQFSNFRINQTITRTGYDSFISDVLLKIKEKGKVTISPHENPDMVKWLVKKKKNKLHFQYISKKFVLKDFANFLLSYLRTHDFVIILFENHTKQYVDQKEVYELWGYRMMFLEDTVIMNPVSHQELFDAATINVDEQDNKLPNKNIIYCGPEGKIYGWDHV